MIDKIVFETDFYGQVTGKKNNKAIAWRRNGQPFIRSNAKAIEQEAVMAENFAYDMRFRKLKPEDFEGRRIEVIVEVWNKDERKHDLDNQVSTILDALVKAEVLPDDSQKSVQKITAEYKGVDRDDPRAWVTVIAVR